jgi:predicted phage baseplate assembly protein
MTDLLLYRLNRVPDRNYIKFMDLLGIRLEPARPATTDINFRLSAALPDDTLIPVGTSVGTLRSETQAAVTFATDRDLTIRVPQLAHVLASRVRERFVDYTPALTSAQRGLGVFSDRPRADDGLYLGFANDLSSHTLAITLRCRIEGIGVDPTDPPLAWETWSGVDHRWIGITVEQDGTGGLNRDGLVIVRLPYEAAQTTLDNRTALWVRARVLDARPGQPAYSDSPRITGVEVESLAAMVPATHSRSITGEVLGTSDGSPAQTFRLQSLPVLSRREGETLEIEGDDGTFEPWVEVADFGRSEGEPHFARSGEWADRARAAHPIAAGARTPVRSHTTRRSARAVFDVPKRRRDHRQRRSADGDGVAVVDPVRGRSVERHTRHRRHGRRGHRARQVAHAAGAPIARSSRYARRLRAAGARGNVGDRTRAVLRRA